jgi:hypothetical protein
MVITTSPKIWAHPDLLTVVHQANEIIEREAGPKSWTMAVYWGLAVASRISLQVTVVDTTSPNTPFALNDVTDDRHGFRQEFRKWIAESYQHE